MARISSTASHPTSDTHRVLVGMRRARRAPAWRQWRRPLAMVLGIAIALTGGVGLALFDAPSAQAASGGVVVNSTGRNSANGYFQWDATVSASGHQGHGDECDAWLSYSCTISLEAHLANGDVRQLSSATSWDSAYSTTSTGEMNLKEVDGLRRTVSGWDGTTNHVTSSSWVPVSDTYPSGSIDLTVNSVGRDPVTGEFQWDVTTTASNYWLESDGPCTYWGCGIQIEAKRDDGTVVGPLVSRDGIYGQPYPHSEQLIGQSYRPHLVALRAVILEDNNSNNVLRSAWVPITDNMRVPTATVSVQALRRDPVNGKLQYDVTATATNFWRNQTGPCLSGNFACSMFVEARTVDGSQPLGEAMGVDSYEATNPYVATRSGEINSAEVTGFRAVVFGFDDAHNRYEYHGPWKTVADMLPEETRGGVNPAENVCPCRHGDPVNTNNGELFENDTDLTLAGFGPAVALGRTYSSTLASTDSPFGYGWSPTFSAHLDALPTGKVRVTQENGAVVTFTTQPDGSFEAPDRVLATLTQDASGDYTVVRRTSTTLTFDNDGRLTAVADLHGNEVAYTRDSSGKVVTISGSGGRSIDLTWSGLRVASATDSAGRTVEYTYDGNGDLRSVTAADGATTNYRYDGHRLNRLTKPDGGMTNTYYYDGVVIAQDYPDNTYMTFTYDLLGGVSIRQRDESRTKEYYVSGGISKRIRNFGDPTARTETFAYDDANNMVASTDGRGNTTTVTYDDQGNVLTKTDPLDHTVTFTYDALNNVTSTTDAKGKTSTATYNSAGDQLTATSRGGVQQSWSYNPNGTVATWTDGRGKSSSYAYNARGLQTSVTDPDGRTTSVGYNAAGFVTSKTNGANKTTMFTRDALGRELTVTTPEQHTTTTTYDDDGNVLTFTDARGKVTTNEYDVLDRLTSTTDPLGHETTYSYTALGQLKNTTDPAGKFTTRAYNPFGELISVTDPNGHATTYAYDKAGNRTKTTLPSGAESTSTYDEANRLASSTDGEGHTTDYAYDANGQLVSTTDPLDRVTAQTWTDDGQHATTTLPDDSEITQTYTAIGALATYTNPDGLVTSYSYSDAGLPTSKTEPGTMATSYTYDSAGRLKTTTTPDGHVVTLTYDDDGNVVTSHSDKTGSTDVTYTYNANAQRTAMHDVTGTTSYDYDDAGQLTGTTNGAGKAIGYDYTVRGLVASITYPGTKVVEYAYDDTGQMTGLTDWANRTTTFGWTADGQLHTTATPNGVTETSTYDDNGRATDMTVAGTAAIADYGYTWNAAGELVGDTTTDSLGGNVTHAYTYDDLSQLASVDGTGAPKSVTATSGGQLTLTADGTAHAYNGKQQLTSSTPTTGPATAFTYDGNGSRTSATVAAVGTTPASTTDYTYDRDGNLASVALPGGPTISYTADGDGLRQSRADGTSTKDFLWDTRGGLPLLLDDGDHTYLYGPGITPIAQIDHGTETVQYLQTDLLGSVRNITNAAGASVGATRFTEFGSVDDHSGASSAISYTGAWTDSDTTLVYLRARDYDPTTGQFIQVDPAVDDTRQPYAYASNSPLNLSDPTGLKGGPKAPHKGNGESSDAQWNEAAAFFNRFNPVHWVAQGFADDVSSANSGCSWSASAMHGVDGVLSAASVVPGVGAVTKGLRTGGTALATIAGIATGSSKLAEASTAAFRAADRIDSWAVSAKHLPGAGGGYAKFADGVDINAVVAEALRSPNASFLPNSGPAGRFIVQANLGVVVGSKGQSSVKIVVTDAGDVVTAYPLR